MATERARDVDVCERCGGFCWEDAACGCGDALQAFAALMDRELRANFDKGGRSSWIQDEPASLLPEVADHAAKLHVAARELIRRRAGRDPRPLPWGDRPAEEMVAEFAADTANMALMLLDSLGLLPGASPR